MMIEFAYKNQLFIIGKVKDLTKRLSEHSKRYPTLKELLDDIVPKADN